MSEFEEKTLKKEIIYDGKIIEVQHLEVQTPDEKIAHREIVKHRGAVCILPVTAEGNIILVRQYRKAIEDDLWEIPAGKIEEGEKDLALVACRELEEEIQCKGILEQIMSFYPSPGFSNELLTFFIATNLEQVENPRPRDEDEFLEVRCFTMDEIETLFKNKVLDAKTMIALQYYKLQMRK